MSNDYKVVKEAMAAGTPLDLICGTCPWDRLCIQPPTMTAEQIDGMIKDAEAKDMARNPNAMPTGMIMTALTFAGKDSAGQLCPVFATRLRQERRTADVIRELMRGYEERP